jgi:site-specific DNA recombinase
VIDNQTTKIVKQVFAWYVEEKLTIDEIIRRLNDDESIPLPPRCTSGVWTRLAVLRLLKNTRYRGIWQYGVTESFYDPDGDYTRQKFRLEPLKEVVLEELRVVDDEIWFAAQTRLAKEGSGNRGRKSTDGESSSRPRLCHKLFFCPEHEHLLYVGGPYGRSLFCSRCRGTKAEKRPLYTLLNRKLALKLTCDRLAELVRADNKLVQEVIAFCQQEAEKAQQPDPECLQQLRSRDQKLQRSILFNQRNPGELEEEQAATAALIRELRQERNEVLLEIANYEKARERRIVIPTEDTVRCLLSELEHILAAAADGKVEGDEGIVREIIDLFTGGRIKLYQMGKRAKNQGWLQGRFRCDLVSALAVKVSGVQPSASPEGIEVIIGYRRELAEDEQSEEAFQLYNEGKLGKEIAITMKKSRSYVCKLLDHAFSKRGLVRPDGRQRRHGLDNKQVKTPVYQKIADQAVRMMKAGRSDLAIARHFNTSDATVSKSIAHWHTSRGLPVPTAEDRRRMKL